MIKQGSFFLFFLFCWFSGNAIHVIPYPNKVNETVGSFVFNAETRWEVENDEQAQLIAPLLEQFRVAADFRFEAALAKDFTKNRVVFKTNKSLQKEAYYLLVANEGITIEASARNGFYYALQTLRQLLPPQIFSSSLVREIKWDVPGVEIEDAPRFGYRGFMLDVARHFLPKNDVLKIIDYLALHKINYLHLHLVDDNGWRLEIKKYPRLTDVGAWRPSRESIFPGRQNTINGEPTPAGGYYTQEEIREMVVYGREHAIEIIPEIEMPAHTVSSLAAFPNLACPMVDEFIGVIPGAGGRLSSVIYCAGNDKVFSFLEDVMDEVVDLFPSEYVHIGGDEARKDNWKKCPRCQKRIKEEGLEDENALEGWFMKRMAGYLKTKGKKVMGWDELTNNEMPGDATIFGWQGLGHAAFKAADLGHPIILTPARVLYFIRYQGPQWFEPYTYFGNNTMFDVYDYEPLSAMTDAQAQHLKGVQACLWSEFSANRAEAEYLTFPRLAAHAELAWTHPENKNWPRFLKSLDNLQEVYSNLGINYARSMYNISHSVVPHDGQLEVELNCIRPDVEIRYTLNGSEPVNDSELYHTSFKLKHSDTPRAATFQNGNRVGEVLSLNCRYNLATGKAVTSTRADAWRIANGLLGSEKITDGEFVDIYNSDAEFVIDLGEVFPFETVSLSFFNNYGMAVHLPSEILISISEHGEDFNLLAQRSIPEPERFAGGLFHKMCMFSLPETKGRYLRIGLKGPGICPPGHVKSGQFSRMAIDEVMVK